MQKSQFERIGEAGRRRGGVAEERSQFKGDHRKHIQMRRSSLKSCYSGSMSEALLNGKNNIPEILHTFYSRPSKTGL